MLAHADSRLNNTIVLNSKGSKIPLQQEQGSQQLLTFIAWDEKTVGWGVWNASRPLPPESTLTGVNPCGRPSRPAKS